MRCVFTAPLLLALLLPACPELPIEEVPENVAPRARFSAPVWVQAGTEVAFDASDSFDPDGTITAYRFLFGDGTPETVSASPRVTHVFGSAGAFTIWLSVVDGSLAEGRAAHGIGVTLEAPAPSLAAGDCGSTERCDEDGLCYQDGPGDACVSDAECAGKGLGCHGGVCTDPECEDDTMCAEGERCRTGRCFPEALDGGETDAG